MRTKFVSFLIVFLIAAVANACNRCGHSYCTNCSFGYTTSSLGYYPSSLYLNNGSFGKVIQREDGTFWLGETQMEKVKIQCNSETGWCWSYAPKRGAYAAAPAALAGSSYAEQGTTVYGYNKLSEIYKPTDLALAFNQAARFTDKALELGPQAISGYQAIVESEGNRQAKVAEIIAKGQAAAQALNASNPTAGDSKSSVSFKITQGAGQATIPQPANNDDLSKAKIEILTASCIQCHNATNPNGQLDLTKYESFTQDQKDAVFAAIVDPDPNKRMPKVKAANGFSPGEPLPLRSIRILGSF